ATVSVTATVVNVAPVANAGPAQSVAAGTLVTLDGSASSDANNDALTYSWSLTSKPAGSGAALLSPTSVRPTFTADVAGTYVASLTVNDGKVSSSAATVSVTATSLTNLTLTLPARSIHASQLAVIVAAGDKLSEDIASYYQNARGIPAANIVRVTLTTGVETISATDFATLKAQIDAALPSNVQATLLTWNAPSRVVGSCAMGITSAMALGFDAKYCATSCATTAASPYYDSESALPWVDHKLRPSMMLGASTLAAAKTLIDRGVQADASLPTGDGYLLRTSDANRSVRYTDYAALPGLWAGNSGLQLSYIDNSAGAVSDGISGKSNVLFYFTGLAGVPPALTSNSFRPGALADSLTSTGGYLPGGNGQMPITAWLDAGATASYGTVEEPCNYTQKFSRASVLIDQYYRGATLIEAYWKAVQWPGQGLFIGEPLAQPFRDSPSFSVDAGQYLISTRALRANSSYSLQYQSTSAGSWVTLGSFKVTRAQPQSWRVSLPPGNATQLRWLGPCPAN
ncbi:MAG: TIGR03790 family protein, partial [Comamonadaceae bacterium]